MPNFISTPISSKIPTSVKINGVPLKIVVGSKKIGMLTGIGVHMGSERQLFRMDWHTWRSSHGNKSGLGVGGNELAAWPEGNFHYHVNKW